MPHTKEREDPDDLGLGTEIWQLNSDDKSDIMEYKLHYEDLPIKQIATVIFPESSGLLSTMINATDTYENLDQLQHITDIYPILADNQRKYQKENLDYKPMMTFLEEKQVPENRNEANRIVAESQYYVIDDGTLYHLYQPRSKNQKWTDVKKQQAEPSKMRNDVLKSYHDALTGGHQEQERTYEATRLKYFGQNYIQMCRLMSKHVKGVSRLKGIYTGNRHYLNHFL